MASEASTVRPRSQHIDPDFLARLARPTQASASKVVDKSRIHSPPAPILARKFGGSQKSRKSDEGTNSTRPSMDDGERPVFEDNGPRDYSPEAVEAPRDIVHEEEVQEQS